MKPVALILWTVAYTGFYAGWFFHRSIHRYPVTYALLLAVFSFGFLVPFALNAAICRLGRRRFVLGVGPTGGVLLLAYAGASTFYYHTRHYPFDPILQKPPVLLTEYPREKPPGVFRILTLGGSTTAGIELAIEDRYPAVLRDLLQSEASSPRIEILNVGKGWHSTQHSLIHYVTYCRDWQPDLVVVMHAVNDLVRSFSPPQFADGDYNERWSHFYGPSMKGARPPTFEQALFDETLGKYWYETLRVRECDMPPERFVSIGTYERNLHALVQILKSDGARVVLVTEPALFKPDMNDEERRALWFGRTFCIERRGFWDQTFPSPGSLQTGMEVYNGVVRRVAAEEGVVLADADAAVPRDLEHFLDDVHHAAPGARKVAETVAQAILAGGLVPDAPPSIEKRKPNETAGRRAASPNGN